MILFRNRAIRAYLPEFVYGSMDGLVTTFAIVMGAVGAGLSVGVIIIVGLASVLSDGFSMGASSYLASVSDESVGGAQQRSALRKAIMTFTAFVALGVVPLAPFLVAYFVPALTFSAAGASLVLTGVAFGFVGFVSGSLIGRNPVVTALRNILIGGTAAGIAYGVAYYLSSVFGV